MASPHCCGACSAFCLFLPCQLPDLDSGSCGPHVCPWGPCPRPQAGSSQRACAEGPGLERGCAGPDCSPPPGRKGALPPAQTPPFHPGLRTKPSSQSVSQKLKEGIVRRAQVGRHRGSTCRSRLQPSQPLSLPRAVLWGRPQHSHFISGCCSQSYKRHTCLERAMAVLFPRLASPSTASQPTWGQVTNTTCAFLFHLLKSGAK